MEPKSLGEAQEVSGQIRPVSTAFASCHDCSKSCIHVLHSCIVSSRPSPREHSRSAWYHQGFCRKVTLCLVCICSTPWSDCHANLFCVFLFALDTMRALLCQFVLCLFAGSVCILGAATAEAEQAVQRIVTRYAEETGFSPYEFRGSSIGATRFGHMRMKHRQWMLRFWHVHWLLAVGFLIWFLMHWVSAVTGKKETLGFQGKISCFE